MKICLFGLGEAGSEFARDLVAAGASVTAYDPAPVITPAGVDRKAHPALAAHGAEMVMALTPEVDAKLALLQAIEVIDGTALYADLSTGSPHIKADLHRLASLRKLDFVDVALMSMVPGLGLATPTLASGPGARRYAQAITALGGRTEVISDVAGTAAGRKLLRSVMMKGFAAVAVESVRAAGTAGDLDWLWSNLVDEIANADEDWLRRLINGTAIHYERRTDEMESAAALLDQLGVEPTMTRATVVSLRQVPDLDVPALPERRPAERLPFRT